jgi:hypothetical protein
MAGRFASTPAQGRRSVKKGRPIARAAGGRDLRDCVESAIAELIEPVAWQRCAKIQEAEQESLREVLDSWSGVP